MSHFISGQRYLEAQPIIAVPNRKVVSPKYKKSVKDMANVQKSSQNLYVNSIFRDLSIREKEIVRKKNQSFMKRQYKKLKKQMREFLSKNSYGKNSIDSCFEGSKQNKRLDIKLITNNVPQTIDIRKRHHNKIFYKLKMMQEAKQINKEKQKYQKWMNREHNSPVRSPNYIKMNFLLEKLKQKEEIAPFHRQSRHTVGSAAYDPVVVENKERYSPKLKRIQCIKKSTVHKK